MQIAMARPVRKDPHELPTQEKLIGAAIVHFARNGFAATRLEDIAGDVGISRPSLLHHFPSKELMYEAAFARVLDQLAAHLASTIEDARAIATSDASGQWIPSVCRSYFRHLREHPEHAKLLVREMMEPLERTRELVSSMVYLIDRVAAVVQPLIKDPTFPVRTAIVHIALAETLYAAAPHFSQLLGEENDGTDRIVESLVSLLGK